MTLLHGDASLVCTKRLGLIQRYPEPLPDYL